MEIKYLLGIDAGGETDSNQNESRSFLGKFGFFGNGSDPRNAIKATLGDKDGVTVIMGTGIIAYAVSGDTRHRIGGRGGSRLMLSLVEKRFGSPLTE